MDLQSILGQYLGGNAEAHPASTDHFSQVANQVPTNVVGGGLADAFRSDRTPPFGQMIGDLFGRSNPQQQAGVLNQLVAALGPAMAGGALSNVLGNLAGKASGANITPDQAQQLSPGQVSEIAAHAERQDPGIVDRLGEFYAQHPDLVRTLGAAAVSIVMARIANGTQR